MTTPRYARISALLVAIGLHTGCSREQPPVPPPCGISTPVACSDGGEHPGGEDSGQTDAGEWDAGSGDAGTPDAGQEDGGTSTPDEIPPGVLSTTPPHGAVDVGVLPDITATFSEPVDLSSLTPETFCIARGSNSSPGVVTSSAATATFSLGQLLILGGTYTATLTTGIRDLAGNPLPQNYQWTFTIRDGRWRDTNAGVALPETGDTSYPRMATTPDGHAFAVWVYTLAGRRSIWANQYIPGPGWGEAYPLEVDDTGDASSPWIALDSRGRGLALWAQQIEGTTGIWARRYIPGQGWQAPEQINPGFESCSSPQLAMAADGRAVATWVQFDGTYDNIWARLYSPDAGWGSAQLLEAQDLADAHGPQAAIDIGGQAVVVWSQDDGSAESIWANRYDPMGGWSTAQLLERDDAGDALNPHVAARGSIFVVWSQFDGRRFAVWGTHFVPGIGWATATKIDTANELHSSDPRVAIDPDDQAVAVWSQFDGARTNIQSNRFAPGTGWGLPQRIETDNQGNANHPELVIDDVGNVTAVWQQWDGSRISIWANRYIVGRGWGLVPLVDTSDSGDATWPHVAVDAYGRTHAIWQQLDGRQAALMSNRFE